VQYLLKAKHRFSNRKQCKYTGVGKIRFTLVRKEKGMQVMIITVALLTQKNVTMAQCT
jgi:hypothetical protein